MRKLLLLFLLFTTAGMKAADKVPGVVVELSSGSTIEIALLDNPKMVFDGSVIKLTATNINVEYAPSEVVKVTIGEVEKPNTGIDTPQTQQGNIWVEDGFVRLTGFAPNEPVCAYLANGTQIAAYKADSAGALFIDMSNLPSGITIIKTRQQSIKISKR